MARNKATAIMLEPLDPANGPPASGGDVGGASCAVMKAGAQPDAGPVAVAQAVADRRACGGSAQKVPDDRACAAGWSSDWLQLSHELRTPLNAILGNIELLLDGSAGPLAAPARACIGDIQVASRQLLCQLQPLLLLVQARTSGALATSLPLDLLGLIRQASEEKAHEADRRGPGGHDAAALRGKPCLPEGVCLMVPGDPVWLGALAAALVDLHAAARGARGPLAIELEQQDRAAGGVVVRAYWAGLDPAATSPLPLTLIDAVLALHGGRIDALSADGLWLDLPIAALAPSRRSDCGTASHGRR
jgi:hypothetical protein